MNDILEQNCLFWKAGVGFKKPTNMELYVKETDIEVTRSTTFRILGFPNFPQWPENSKEFLREIDDFLISKGQKEPFMSLAGTGITIVITEPENSIHLTPAEVLEKVKEIAPKYFDTSPA